MIQIPTKVRAMYCFLISFFSLMSGIKMISDKHIDIESSLPVLFIGILFFVFCIADVVKNTQCSVPCPGEVSIVLDILFLISSPFIYKLVIIPWFFSNRNPSLASKHIFVWVYLTFFIITIFTCYLYIKNRHDGFSEKYNHEKNRPKAESAPKRHNSTNVPSTQNMPLCPRCHSAVNRSDNFCPKCGLKFY